MNATVRVNKEFIVFSEQDEEEIKEFFFNKRNLLCFESHSMGNEHSITVEDDYEFFFESKRKLDEAVSIIVNAFDKKEKVVKEEEQMVI